MHYRAALTAVVSGVLVWTACSSDSTNTTAANNPDGGGSSTSSSTGGPGRDGGNGSTNPDGSSSSGDSGSEPTLPAAKALHMVNGLEPDERVTGIWCEPGATTCVLAANASAEQPHISTFDTSLVSQNDLVATDEDLGNTFGFIGQPTFLGFQKVNGLLVARLDEDGSGFVSATGDPTVKANWSALSLGMPTGDTFVVDNEFGFGFDGAKWIQMRRGAGIFTTASTPGPNTNWTNVWDPDGAPEIPADIDAQKAQNPNICTSEVSYSPSGKPTLLQAGYVAPNGEIILYPSGGANQDSPDGPGICVSTNGGAGFQIVKLAQGQPAPTALTCISKNVCFAGGKDYILYTANAADGATGAWSVAGIPATTTASTLLSAFFFAPDGMHGWVAGTTAGTDPLLWATTDGGQTWTDHGADVTAAGVTTALTTGFASDATHFAVGGVKGQLLSTF